MIIGLTGPARCGKDTVAQHLVESYEFKHFDFYRDVLVKELEKRGLEPTKMNASKLGDELRKKHGQEVMAKLLLEKVDAPRIVVTGVRSPAEVEYFRVKTPSFHLALVTAPPEVRFARRKEYDPQTLEEFLARDENDRKKGMFEVFEMADVSFDNDGGVGELLAKVDEWVQGVLQ